MKPIYFTDTDSWLVRGHAFSEFTTYASSQDHSNWIGDFDDDHGKERRWHNHFHYQYGDGGWNFGDQDWHNDGNGEKKGRAGASGIWGQFHRNTLPIGSRYFDDDRFATNYSEQLYGEMQQLGR